MAIWQATEWNGDPVVAVAPAVEPVGLEEAAEHLRLDSLEESAWLRRAIATARRHAEQFTGRALITQTLEAARDTWPGRSFVLPRPPLQAVTWIKWWNEAGQEATFSPANYVVDTRPTPGRVVLKLGVAWPGDALREANGFVVRYTAGYGEEGAAVPEEARSAILMLVGHLYENREATTAAGGVMTLPFGVERLLWPLRVF